MKVPGNDDQDGSITAKAKHYLETKLGIEQCTCGFTPLRTLSDRGRRRIIMAHITTGLDLTFTSPELEHKFLVWNGGPWCSCGWEPNEGRYLDQVEAVERHIRKVCGTYPQGAKSEPEPEPFSVKPPAYGHSLWFTYPAGDDVATIRRVDTEDVAGVPERDRRVLLALLEYTADQIRETL